MAAAAILKLGRNRKIGLRDLVRTGLYYIRTNFHEVPMKFTFFQDGGRRHFEIRKKSKNRAPGSCSHGSILYTYKFSRSSDEIYFFPRWRPAAILKLGRNRKIGHRTSLRIGP